MALPIATVDETVVAGARPKQCPYPIQAPAEWQQLVALIDEFQILILIFNFFST